MDLSPPKGYSMNDGIELELWFTNLQLSGQGGTKSLGAWHWDRDGKI